MKNETPKKRKPRKSKGQSLVEIAIAFPILIMLFAGVVEFGFIINYYLSLLDATREAARFYSGADPFLREDPTDTKLITGNDPDFYGGAAAMVRANLDPFFTDVNYKGRRIVLDPAVDDVIVTVYRVDVANDEIIPLPGDASDEAFHIYGNVNYPSIFSVDQIRDNFLTDAPNAGILVIEVHYNYHQILALPWITAFLPNPLHLQAYTMFPLNAAEPVVP